MNILINTNTLRNALQDIIGVVSKDLSMPILRHVLIEKSNSQISITGTNIEMQITVQLDYEESDEFDPITVSGRKLYEIVRSLNDQNLQITTSKDRLILKTNNSTFKLATLPANNFISFDETEFLETFTINQRQLLDLLNKTSFSIATNLSVRKILCGLLLEIDSNKLTAVATDAHRLAISSTHLDKSQINNLSCVVPRKAVIELIRILKGDKKAKVSVGRNQIRVDFKGISFISKLFDGKFPTYQRFIPLKAEIEVLLEKQTIRSALERASILFSETYKAIRIEASNETIVLSAENLQQEEAKETIENQSDATNQNKVIAGFNARYLLEAINACSGQKIVIGINGATDIELKLAEAEGGGNYSINEDVTKDKTVVGEVKAWSPQARKLKIKSIGSNNQNEPLKILPGDVLVGATSGASYTIENKNSKYEATIISSPSDSNTRYIVMPYNI